MKRQIKVFYICDRKQCENCNEECKHTSNIVHSVNYKEKPKTFTNFERHTRLIDGQKERMYFEK